jgi:hypothetical protein
MSQTSRERVIRALTFDQPDRIPRDTWSLPGGRAMLDQGSPSFNQRFPSDFAGAGELRLPSARVQGNASEIGIFVDDWGVVWHNAEAGHIGEVKQPILAEFDDWRDIVQPPDECLRSGADLQTAIDRVNRACAASDRFIKAGCCPRPWERYQFLRGTEDACCDLLEEPETTQAILARIHEHYLRELEQWVQTDVDGIMFMDDWGSQQSLLISPETWRAFFKPLYRDYCELARAHGKFIFMHSDGHIAAIYPDLVELGVNALNSQLFCMDLDQLAAIAKGKLTFWGEIDRQHVLCHPDPERGRAAVRQVAEKLYDPAGGIIAQFEVGADTCLATACAIHEEWERIGAAQKVQV